jgi:hypothetical protein
MKGEESPPPLVCDIDHQVQDTFLNLHVYETLEDAIRAMVDYHDSRCRLYRGLVEQP